MLDFRSQTLNARVPVTVITPTGNIDSSNFHTFQAYVDEQVANGARYILLNFQNTAHTSSAGLRVIHNLFNKLREIHKEINDDELRKKMSVGAYKSPYLKICSLSPSMAEVFQLGGFDIYIELLQDETTALKSF
jgi:anti-anti-sigma regulatory factor